jgi:5-methylcytosine-specific restriction protein A
MPSRPASPCGTPRCPNLRPCPVHAPKPWATTTTSRHRRGYGTDWDKLRARKLKANPWCEECGARAVAVDHRVPKAEGGTDRWENLQSLCSPCEKRKTGSDGNRGMRRVGEGRRDR